MREFKRTDRVAGQLQQDMAALIQCEVKDPRLEMVTISSVKVSRDLGYADVYVTLLGENDPARVKGNLAVLKRAAGFLRSKIARRIKLHHVPELRFHYDDSVMRGHQLSVLIDEAVASNRPQGDGEASSQDENFQLQGQRIPLMSRYRRRLPINGVLLLDKPKGLSSNHALQRARRLFQARKAGHTGTLDPMATGLLLICLGEATKFSANLLEADKVYRTRIQFGIVTDTGDAEGEVVERLALPETLNRDAVEAVLERFRGEIEQIPPMYSALKHQGRKLYELARQGKTVARASRRVMIYDMRPLDWELDGVWLQIRCSKGTYIRTLAEGIGAALGYGAHITALERLETGSFNSKARLSLEVLEAMSEEERLAQLLPVDTMLAHLPVLKVADNVAHRLLLGQRAAMPGIELPPGTKARLYRGEFFLGLAEMTMQGEIAPRRLVDTAALNSDQT